MARSGKTPPTPTDETTPQSYPETPPPRDLYPTSDIRFVLVELGKLSTKIDILAEGIKDQASKLQALERTVDRFKTGGIVAGSLLSLFAVVFWWMLGDRINNAVQNGLLGQQQIPSHSVTLVPSGNSPQVPPESQVQPAQPSSRPQERVVQ